MSTQTILLIIFAVILALALSLFQYFFKSKRTRLSVLLAFLRFISWLAIFLLLINPKFTSEEIFVEKSNLVLLFDNSSSIESLGGTSASSSLLQELSSNASLQEKFDLHTHFFDNGLQNKDSLSFNGQITNLTESLRSLNEVYRNAKNTLVLVTDGNQNIGNDYEFYRLDSETSVFAVVVGDTTNYEDLAITRVNSNRYSFLDNQFPFEATLTYSGSRNLTSQISVSMNGQRVFRENLNFSPSDNSKVIRGLLTASSVGLKTLRFALAPIANEKNTANNNKELAIEIIDEQTKIALVSDIMHPDLGALKKAIESNNQRSIAILKPQEASAQIDSFDFFILYQPTRNFEELVKQIENKKAGYFLFASEHTGWRHLNTLQNDFTFTGFNQPEEVLPIKNNAFELFDISDFEVSNFPPIRTELGEFEITRSHQVLLWQEIKGLNTDIPLLFTVSDASKRAYFLGEGIWQWRAQVYRENQNFEPFDNFMDQLLRYLSDSKPRNRLQLQYNPVFESPSLAFINATYYDEAYNFDPEAKLELTVEKLDDKKQSVFPLLLGSNSFQADLSSLEEGEYTFTVRVLNENMSRSGRFKILNFNLEEQLSAANAQKLQRFAVANNGALFFPDQINTLLDELVTNDQFTPVQKSIKNVVPLIDFEWLLMLIALSLAAEWFIRKYNGLL